MSRKPSLHALAISLEARSGPLPESAVMPSELIRRTSSMVISACTEVVGRIGGHQLRRIGVTSAVRGEGRTSISIGLGIALASEYGRRTLVLDLDLEHQDCAHRLGIPRGDGLWGILAGRSSAPDVLHEVGGGLWAIRAGMFSGSASRMASAIAETGVIDEIAADFDVLVADLPPVLTPVGPQLIDLFGSTLLVARSASTSGRLVRRAMEHLPSEAAVLVNGAHSDLPMWIRRIVDR